MCSATSHLGGKMTKSSNATPGLSVGAVNTAHENKSGQKVKKNKQFYTNKKREWAMKFLFLKMHTSID